MSMLDRFGAAYRAFTAGPIVAAPAKDAVKLRSMPKQAPGRRASKKRLERQAFDYRRWMPSDVENALHVANGSGVLTQAAAIGAFVKSNPIVKGVMEGCVSTPWLPYGIKYSDEASAWLMGTDMAKGWRDQITDPAELEAVAADDYNSGWGVGIFIWNEQKGRPEHVALDNAGVRYLLGEDRYQYQGWNRVFDIEPGNGIWTLKTRVKSDPWRDGAWHKLAYGILDSLQGDMQRAVWMHVFSMPTILAKYPLGSSEGQKATYTNSIIGAALRVIGVTPGYDLDFKQASAEGSDTFKDVNERLERIVSIYVWGTIGLLAGGSGFSNSDLFEQMRSGVVGKEARRQAKFENDQIWPVVLDWAVKAGHISKKAASACIEYNPETPAVILKKAQAAKELMGVGYSPEEAQLRAGIEKQSHGGTKDEGSAKQEIFAYHLDKEIFTKNEVRASKGYAPRDDGDVLVGAPLAGGETPEAREPDLDEPAEPDYSENMARRMNERGDVTCPHGREKYCRSCGVRLRHKEQGNQWVSVWVPARAA